MRYYEVNRNSYYEADQNSYEDLVVYGPGPNDSDPPEEKSPEEN